MANIIEALFSGMGSWFWELEDAQKRDFAAFKDAFLKKFGLSGLQLILTASEVLDRERRIGIIPRLQHLQDVVYQLDNETKDDVTVTLLLKDILGDLERSWYRRMTANLHDLANSPGSSIPAPGKLLQFFERELEDNRLVGNGELSAKAKSELWNLSASSNCPPPSTADQSDFNSPRSSNAGTSSQGKRKGRNRKGRNGQQLAAKEGASTDPQQPIALLTSPPATPVATASLPAPTNQVYPRPHPATHQAPLVRPAGHHVPIPQPWYDGYSNFPSPTAPPGQAASPSSHGWSHHLSYPDQHQTRNGWAQ